MIDAIYFDGQSTRRQPVTLVIHKRVMAMRGADGLHRTIRLSRLTISERLQHAPRLLRFPDGAFIESSHAGLDKMLRKNGYRDPWVVRWQQHWLWSLLALMVLLATLVSAYQWGLPWAADGIAQRLPASMERKIGDEQLAIIDQHMLKPSRLGEADRLRLQQRFAAMRQPRGERTPYRLEFRQSQVGPNAFALPNGVIVMTDELVKMAGNDEAVLGVLSHELGHLQRRHTLRNLLQVLGVGVMVNLWIGDVSSVLAAVPTFLLDQKYSRDFEREADQYAIDMMRANGLPLTPMAVLFEKMHADDHGADADSVDDQDAGHAMEEGDGDKEPLPPSDEEQDKVADYFSSHPSDAERIARLRAADRRQ